MSDQDPIVITGAMRTALGGFQGALAGMTASEIGATAIKAALEHSALDPTVIDEVVMGCVLPAGQGQAPARQASLGAGLPLGTNSTTINKMCGSGMKAAMFAHDLLLAGSAKIAIAGGMESMTNAPYLLPKAREGMRMGHGQVLDHMFLDGLEDAYDKGRLMGSFAGAAALVMMRRSEADARGLEVLATVLGHTTHAHEPNWFTTAPVHAMRKLFEQLNCSQSDIDLYEVNEAFAVVTMAAIRELDLPADRVNIHGGACALGHPIGASGARILVTLLHALQEKGLKKGMASLCIGGGEATAMAIELA